MNVKMLKMTIMAVAVLNQGNLRLYLVINFLLFLMLTQDAKSQGMTKVFKIHLESDMNVCI